MKIAIIGLGSMGRRRLRNLRQHGKHEIYAFDNNEIRKKQVIDEFGINILENVEDEIREGNFDAAIISTSPDWHMHYAELFVESKIPVFIEASVVETERVGVLAQKAHDLGTLVAPSCTMRFFEGPKLVKHLILDGQIGTPLFFTYHTGQWLEDWHPWESINDFYVSKIEMGGCREIVPFELTWLNDIFGEPEVVGSVRDKISTLSAEIDDIYQIQLKYPNNVKASLVVEVLSRPFSSRELRIVGTEGIIKFSADDSSVQLCNSSMNEWKTYIIQSGTKASGAINPDEPYFDELSLFLGAAMGENTYPNTLSDDYKILRTLDLIDEVASK